MATIKSYTDLQQSKELIKFLPPESADHFHIIGHLHTDGPRYEVIRQRNEVVEIDKYWPCWSLAALLNVLDFPSLSKDKLGGGKIGWMVSVYPDNCRYDSCWHDNPVDACVEMILMLKEKNLL